MVRAYVPHDQASHHAIPGVGDALTALGPLLRPFITRWWTDKTAQLNPDVEAARSVLEFEDFRFGRDRVALERIADGLLDLQDGTCFYCRTSIGRNREIDHFVPWSYSGDDGIDNWSLRATSATTASAPLSPARNTSLRSSSVTRPGTLTSPPCPSSGAGLAVPAARTESPVPPICALAASARSGSAPEPG